MYCVLQFDIISLRLPVEPFVAELHSFDLTMGKRRHR